MKNLYGEKAMTPSFSWVGKGTGSVHHTNKKADSYFIFVCKWEWRPWRLKKFIAPLTLQVIKNLRLKLYSLSMNHEKYVIDSHSASVAMEKCNVIRTETDLQNETLINIVFYGSSLYWIRPKICNLNKYDFKPV